jgi:hypothetical protein
MNDTSLVPLLAYLEQAWPDAPCHWADWAIQPIRGGANNRLYRVTGPGGDFAVKWTLRDQHDRAGREYAALQLLAQHGGDLAPRAVALERDRFRLPVVVQTWLAGEPLAAPPETDADWRSLVAHFVAVHSVVPGATPAPLAEAVLMATSMAEAQALVARQAVLLPDDARPPLLQDLLRRLMTWEPQPWPPPRRTLCRADPNHRNLLRRDGPWASVDWEYSGWGDPAFVIADLLTHPAYQTVPPARWAWVTDLYAELVADPGLEYRMSAYTLALRVWWAVRWARTLYEVPRGLDQRLVERGPSWQDEAARALERALEQAEEGLRTAPVIHAG